ncbi:hypothetical protein EJ05DRAFT_484048 [Pseudovirgaria hyperparasitica]|uniref:Rhodopsin domain-containing protein n=1 Tax=Pseudovirgaria hyperparasitica TaxID=470096 RepID=A0A6A6WDP1_9PEZI|nr:uncharacterized protein EJ05DRAFT_484048 [Pseudovirgaria hyperparasitica]KAF2760299.1 hypothetical protein EJ05DRAFT_484048 [Pseudovirgaria hyperparasitica]
MLVPPTTPARQSLIDHAGRIDKVPFVVTLWVTCALGTFAAMMRLVLRLRVRHRFSLDDYLIIFATSTAMAMNVTMFYFVETIFLVEAINVYGIVPTPEERAPLLNGVYWRHIVLSLSWTAICTIKFSFLAFFKDLVHGVSRHITRFYWATAVLVFLCYGFCLSQSFILCPYFGDDRRKCFPDSPRAISIAANTIAACLDIISDAMIVAIPILVLRKARMAKKQKLAIAAFLCLSITMIIIALIRVAGADYVSIRNKHDFDTTWQAFWQHIETNLAVFMGSVMMMRSIFITVIAEHSKGSKDGSKSATGSLVRSWMFASKSRNTIDVGHVDPPMELRRASYARNSTNSSRSLVPKHASLSAGFNQPATIAEMPPVEMYDDDYHSFKRQDKESLRSFSQWDFDFNSLHTTLEPGMAGSQGHIRTNLDAIPDAQVRKDRTYYYPPSSDSPV